MSRQSKPDRHWLAPTTVNQKRPNWPADGTDAVYDMMRVAAAAVNELPSRMAWNWPVFAAAPSATITSVASDDDMSVAGAATKWEIPWLVQKGFDQVRFSGYLQTPLVAGTIIGVRFVSETFITAVATVTTPYAKVDAWWAPEIHSEIASDEDAKQLLMGMFSVTMTPEIPADRLIKLSAQVRYDLPVDVGAALSVTVGLGGLYVEDVISDISDG